MSITHKWVDLRERYLDTPEARAAYDQARKELEAELAQWRPALLELPHDLDACPFCSVDQNIRSRVENGIADGRRRNRGWQCGRCGLAITDLGTMHEIVQWEQSLANTHIKSGSGVETLSGSYEMVCPHCKSRGEFVDYVAVAGIDELRHAGRLLANAGMLDRDEPR